MNWEYKRFAARAGDPPGERRTSPEGFQFAPKPPLPWRDSYFAVSDVSGWDGVADAMVQFWLKVAEVFPRYYAGNSTPDPMAAEPPLTVAPDAGWNRIVCLLDPVYGKVTTNLWKGDAQPKHMDRVWVIIKFAMIETAYTNDSSKRAVSVLMNHWRKVVAEAAKKEPAASALKTLRAWRSIDLWSVTWIMNLAETDTLKPLSKAR